MNIGCGSNIASDWINIDLANRPNVFCWDCRRSLPFEDGSATAIFAEHVFEHFDPNAAARFLSECYRCLRLRGVLRLVVPDAGMYLMHFDNWNELKMARPLIEENGVYRDYSLGQVYRTKMELINEVFRQGSEHKYAYDTETLMLKLYDAGFACVVRQTFGISMMHEVPLDTPERKTESLYIDARK